jgi:hypothetical protein
MSKKSDMGKTVALFGIILFLSLFIVPVCEANVVVSPAEIHIIMKDEFIEGSTYKTVTVTNRYTFNVSVNVWMSHPDILEWMRPNRTLIDNLSWISIEPSSVIIPYNESAVFYINFSIQNESIKNQSYDKNWEIWAAFKINAASGSSSSLKEGYLVRVYVDTPKTLTEPDGSLFIEEIVTYILILVIIIVLVVVIFYLFSRKKGEQKY